MLKKGDEKEKAKNHLADSPWPMLQNNLRHTGFSPYSTKDVGKTIKWTFETGAGIESSPTIAPDGTIYFGDIIDSFYALDLNGKEKWRYKNSQGGNGFGASAAIGSDGTIYVGSYDKKVYAFGGSKNQTEKVAKKEKWLPENRTVVYIIILTLTLLLIITGTVTVIKKKFKGR